MFYFLHDFIDIFFQKGIKMKKNVFLLLIMIFIVLGIGIFFKLSLLDNKSYHYPKRVSGGDDFQFLIHHSKEMILFSYSNYAWVPTHYGEIIFEDGFHYAFDCNETKSLSATECLTKKLGKISNRDLKELKRLGNEMKDKTKIQYSASDFGEILISFHYNGRSFSLIGRGDQEINNQDIYCKKILKILRKYDIYV